MHFFLRLEKIKREVKLDWIVGSLLPMGKNKTNENGMRVVKDVFLFGGHAGFKSCVKENSMKCLRK